ncbi:FAD:protein FMN transferase [Primorskyibacter aestuariivivens]|uniref:FAD:protein FMN transferase n=1 Tax=Primorskyibacter aestuariivivens TaxID=1888912 RepID=UPI0023016F55|nr:FAD:protein FMN transferase [Primorskyibacter aestuariivivens]MDA7430959.1 FAD:protein FMN transferase [Primorskyibacter aestuariivivens]
MKADAFLPTRRKVPGLIGVATLWHYPGHTGEVEQLSGRAFGTGWHAAVASPGRTRPAAAVLRLPSGIAVATSGTSAQSYALNGRVYNHIIDPMIGVPVPGHLRSVSVIAGDAMSADARATALCAAGEQAGPELATRHDIAALFLIDDPGTERRVYTGPIADFIL